MNTSVRVELGERSYDIIIGDVLSEAGKHIAPLLRGKRVIVAGGTGFYIRALCGDVALSDAYDAALRERVAHEFALHPVEVMHDWLAARDPARAATVLPTDRYRVARALEIALCDRSGVRVPVAPHASLRSAGIPFAKVWLEIPDDVLAARIAGRVDAMLAAGLLEEAERIGPSAVAADAVGYPQALAYLSGWSTFSELREGLARATRRYAKRQRTWSRSEPGVTFVGHDDLETLSRAAEQRLGW